MVLTRKRGHQERLWGDNVESSQTQAGSHVAGMWDNGGWRSERQLSELANAMLRT